MIGPESRLPTSFQPSHVTSPDTKSDEELWVEFAQHGCERSLRVLHRRYYDPLHAFIRRCGVHDEARAADLFQDLWVRLVSNRARFDPAMKWGTWACQVAKNLAKNEARRINRRLVAPEADFHVGDQGTIQIESALSTFSPDEMMRERELGEKLHDVLAALPNDQRTLFTLRFITGLSNVEASRALGVPLSALKARAKRVRLRVLREMRPSLDLAA